MGSPSAASAINLLQIGLSQITILIVGGDVR
jgi:hypothetical protein